ncbi:MAG: DUF4167 domain-containing protein [Sphingomonadales bacterium]|nr:DUF4167 domain-containing protein [Sphingomonadales bacterium]
MNNNRQSNNRRRGRNNNRSNNNNNRSGFDHQNRIDNRARGNAAQMLEKYKKLASDAQHNDDRVNAEYYHQFADHYFRVLADFRQRQEAKQEEHQQRRKNTRDDRDEDDQDQDELISDDAGDDSGEEEDKPIKLRQSKDAGDKPARVRRKKKDDRQNDDDDQGGLDLNVLPPSISASAEEEQKSAKPARKPRARRAKAADETLDAAE